MGVYGPLIAGINLIILISSTVLIYLGSVLVHFYLLPSLGNSTVLFLSSVTSTLSVPQDKDRTVLIYLRQYSLAKSPGT